MSAPPAVRISPGRGIALRTSGIIAWFAPPPDHPAAPEADLSGIVRDLVLAAGRCAGIPTDFLTALVARHPWLTVAVVSLGADEGLLWIHGDADVLIEREGQGDGGDPSTGSRPSTGSGNRTFTESFPLPSTAVRLGDPHRAPAWSHLVEGAVPAAGVSLVWAGTEPRQAPAPLQFEAVPLLDAQPVEARPPLPVADQSGSGQGADPAQASGGEVMVPGLRCSRGHFNHPLAANCAWCGIGMIQVSHVLVRRPRPPLGVLVVDGRATFTLDADYVIGRQPERGQQVDGERTRPLVLGADPSISRTHCAIRLREWDVLAEDLNSGMGTWLQQPGQQPFRLSPGYPVGLAPGAVLFIGPHRLTYHSHHLR